MADIALDVQSAPTTPAAGVSVEYVDSTTKTVRSKDDAGTVHHYLDAASSGVTGILKGAGTGPVTAIALPADATKFLDGTGAFSAPSAGGTADNSVVDFRLTLSTGVPVTITDVTGATTVYAALYRGNRIALYDGAAWNIRTSAEFSIALGTLTSGLPYDVFCYDNSTVPTLEILAWTSTSARATALALQDGVLSKTGALTRRYLGTFHTTATTTTEDSASNRYLSNYYNRVDRPLQRTESTSSWTYATATVRQANGSTANKVSFVIGVAEDPVTLDLSVYFSESGGVSGLIGVGIDSTTVIDPLSLGGFGNLITGTVQITSKLRKLIAVGQHAANWLEYAGGATVSYYSGVFPSTGTPQSGLLGVIKG